MFSLRHFTGKFEVPPKHLSKDWRKRFLDTLRKEKNRTICSTTGAILEVQKIESLELPVIHNGHIYVTAQYIALAFQPAVGEEYPGKITLILPLGILIEAEGMVKVLIQANNLPPGYKFDSIRKVFSNGIHSYNVNDMIIFRILSLRYKADEINCIGALKDVKQQVSTTTPNESGNMEESVNETLCFIEPPDEFVE